MFVFLKRYNKYKCKNNLSK